MDWIREYGKKLKEHRKIYQKFANQDYDQFLLTRLG